MNSILLLAMAMISSTVLGQTNELVDNTAPKQVKSKEGWTPKLNTTLSFSQQSSDGVIGQTNGDSISIGFGIDSALIYKKERNELRQNLKINQATAKTPTVPRFTKSADELKYNLIYLRSLKNYSWLGPFVKASLESSLFKGEDFQTGKIVKLTDSFRPVTTKETIGFFAKLLEKDHMNLELRLGFGALQVKADGQLAVDTYDADTNTLTTKELFSYSQKGAELGGNFEYNFDAKSAFKLSVELFQPIDPELNEGDDRSDSELLDSAIEASLTNKAYDWLALSLEAKYKNQPQLSPEEQKQAIMLANLTYSWF